MLLLIIMFFITVLQYKKLTIFIVATFITIKLASQVMVFMKNVTLLIIRSEMILIVDMHT